MRNRSGILVAPEWLISSWVITKIAAAAWEIFRLEELWTAVEALDNVVPAATQVDMMLPVRRLAERALRDKQEALDGLASLFLRDDKPAIRKALLRLRYLDKFADEARARRTNLERTAT